MVKQMKITEVAKKYQLSIDTLRYYERKGLFPKVTRTPGGTRNYTEEDCRWVEYVKCMRNAGVSIETLSEYVRLLLRGDSTLEQRRELLVNERNKISERIDSMQNFLHKLDHKIENYDTMMRSCENKLTNEHD